MVTPTVQRGTTGPVGPRSGRRPSAPAAGAARRHCSAARVGPSAGGGFRPCPRPGRRCQGARGEDRGAAPRRRHHGDHRGRPAGSCARPGPDGPRRRSARDPAPPARRRLRDGAAGVERHRRPPSGGDRPLPRRRRRPARRRLRPGRGAAALRARRRAQRPGLRHQRRRPGDRPVAPQGDHGGRRRAHRGGRRWRSWTSRHSARAWPPPGARSRTPGSPG